jgi:hypothetical protein
MDGSTIGIAVTPSVSWDFGRQVLYMERQPYIQYITISLTVKGVKECKKCGGGRSLKSIQKRPGDSIGDETRVGSGSATHRYDETIYSSTSYMNILVIQYCILTSLFIMTCIYFIDIIDP